jgi:hypothetical protein
MFFLIAQSRKVLIAQPFKKEKPFFTIFEKEITLQKERVRLSIFV